MEVDKGLIRHWAMLFESDQAKNNIDESHSDVQNDVRIRNKSDEANRTMNATMAFKLLNEIDKLGDKAKVSLMTCISKCCKDEDLKDLIEYEKEYSKEKNPFFSAGDDTYWKQSDVSKKISEFLKYITYFKSIGVPSSWENDVYENKNDSESLQSNKNEETNVNDQQSQTVGEGRGWVTPKLDIEKLRTAIQKAKTDVSEHFDAIPQEAFGDGVDYNPQDHNFNAVVKGKKVILQDGLCDAAERGLANWSTGTDREPWTQNIDTFMWCVSMAYNPEEDEVLEWKIEDAVDKENNEMYMYIVNVKPYAINREKETITPATRGKVVQKGY